jgi:hypothetical protein
MGIIWRSRKKSIYIATMASVVSSERFPGPEEIITVRWGRFCIFATEKVPVDVLVPEHPAGVHLAHNPDEVIEPGIKLSEIVGP